MKHPSFDHNPFYLTGKLPKYLVFLLNANLCTYSDPSDPTFILQKGVIY